MADHHPDPALLLLRRQLGRQLQRLLLLLQLRRKQLRRREQLQLRLQQRLRVLLKSQAASGGQGSALDPQGAMRPLTPVGARRWIH